MVDGRLRAAGRRAGVGRFRHIEGPRRAADAARRGSASASSPPIPSGTFNRRGRGYVETPLPGRGAGEGGRATSGPPALIRRCATFPEESATEQALPLVFAIPDHPWVDVADGAAVRIAMTVGEVGARSGTTLDLAEEVSRSTARWRANSAPRRRDHDLRAGLAPERGTACQRRVCLHRNVSAGAKGSSSCHREEAAVGSDHWGVRPATVRHRPRPDTKSPGARRSSISIPAIATPRGGLPQPFPVGGGPGEARAGPDKTIALIGGCTRAPARNFGRQSIARRRFCSYPARPNGSRPSFPRSGRFQTVPSSPSPPKTPCISALSAQAFTSSGPSLRAEHWRIVPATSTSAPSTLSFPTWPDDTELPRSSPSPREKPGQGAGQRPSPSPRGEGAHPQPRRTARRPPQTPAGRPSRPHPDRHVQRAGETAQRRAPHRQGSRDPRTRLWSRCCPAARRAGRRRARGLWLV